MSKRAKRLTASGMVETLNMLFEMDPLAMYRLANLRVACHTLKYVRPDLACHSSDLEFPVMGALELLNVLLTENTDEALVLKIDKPNRKCYFALIDKATLDGSAVLEVPEVL